MDSRAAGANNDELPSVSSEDSNRGLQQISEESLSQASTEHASHITQEASHVTGVLTALDSSDNFNAPTSESAATNVTTNHELMRGNKSSAERRADRCDARVSPVARDEEEAANNEMANVINSLCSMDQETFLKSDTLKQLASVISSTISADDITILTTWQTCL